MIKIPFDNGRLREMLKFDIPKVEKIANEEQIKNFFFPENKKVGDYFNYVPGWNRERNRDYWGFVIEEEDVEGYLSLIKEEKDILLNYFIGQKFRNKGLASKSVNSIIPLASELSKGSLIARVSKENLSSQKVLEKNNFTLQDYISKNKILYTFNPNTNL